MWIYLGARDFFLDNLEAPEFYVFVCAASYEGFSVWVDLKRPDSAFVGAHSVDGG